MTLHSSSLFATRTMLRYLLPIRVRSRSQHANLSVPGLKITSLVTRISLNEPDRHVMYFDRKSGDDPTDQRVGR